MSNMFISLIDTHECYNALFNGTVHIDITFNVYGVPPSKEYTPAGSGGNRTPTSVPEGTDASTS